MKTPRRDAPFPDTPAIMRTPKGMEMFSQLDWEISQQAGPSRLPPQSHEDTPPALVERLQQLSPLVELDEELASEGIHTPDDSAMLIDDVVGDKRKLYMSILVCSENAKTYFCYPQKRLYRPSTIQTRALQLTICYSHHFREGRALRALVGCRAI